MSALRPSRRRRAPRPPAHPAAREIGREFPGWHPWVSSAGRWWAARSGPGPGGVTLDADDETGLREALRAEAEHAAAGP